MRQGAKHFFIGQIKWDVIEDSFPKYWEDYMPPDEARSRFLYEQIMGN